MILLILNYLNKFFAVVVVNCVAYPENLPQCVRVDHWLMQDIEQYTPYLTGERKAYDTEKEYLEDINKENSK